MFVSYKPVLCNVYPVENTLFRITCKVGLFFLLRSPLAIEDVAM